MPKLRDYLISDLDIFINTNEFATIHNINGVDMSIILDDDLLKERQERGQLKMTEPGGYYNADVLFHVKKSDFGEKPVVGEILRLDGEIYRISEVEEDEEMYTITLGANQS